MLNKPKSKAPSQWPINLTKVFSLSHNTPIPDTVSEKWNNETTKEVIKVRYTVNITFTHSKENIDNYFLPAIYTTLYHYSFTCNYFAVVNFFTDIPSVSQKIQHSYKPLHLESLIFVLLYIVLTICLLIG